MKRSSNSQRQTSAALHMDAATVFTHTPLLHRQRSKLIKKETGRSNIPPFPRSWEEPVPAGSTENNGRKLGQERGSSCWQEDPEDESGNTPRTSGYWPAALGSRNWAL